MHINQVRLKREEPIKKINGYESYELQLVLCGGKAGTNVIEEESFQGSLEKVIQAAERWIDERTEGYPKPAVHELLLIAFQNRDFDSVQCNKVLIYENQIAIKYQGSFGGDYVNACEAVKEGITLTLQMTQNGVVSVLSGGSLRLTSVKGSDFTDNERLILSYLQTHSYVTNASAREIVAIGTTATRNLLNGLVDKGYLRAEGANRGRKYYLGDKKIF